MQLAKIKLNAKQSNDIKINFQIKQYKARSQEPWEQDMAIISSNFRNMAHKFDRQTHH
jgi:hypothetical protein